MAKRTWSEAHSANDADASQTQQQVDQNGSFEQDTKQSRKNRAMSSTTNGNGTNGHNDEGLPIPQISRKIKACASCRRHKIKCLMDDNGPPCRRCKERNLGCVLTKNLQSIIDEKSQYSEAIVQDLEHMHAALKDLVAKAGMPDLPPLQSSSLRDSAVSPTNDDNSAVVGVSNHQVTGLSRQDDQGPSCDNSPKISPEDEGLPYVPIHSLYALTKMRALRSPEETTSTQTNSRVRNISDFIARGAVKLEDAERLFALYRDRLDPFMYGVGCKYRTLDEVRRRSTVLTAATLTVAALHDPQSDTIYGACSSEFRRLMEKSMFERRVDRDYLRAMCVASYWISDMSWMLSGYAIRRAAECNLHTSHSRLLTEPSDEAADCARLWYILYICDQHLATLYGRPSIVQEDASIQGWETFLASPVSNDEDKRLASQVALLSTLRGIRELFGPDNGQPIPRVYLNQIAHFNRQLDQWIGHWSNTLLENHHHIGSFPRKGAMLHFHFAKLHLYSHIFRGLPHDSPVPHYFMESATSAVSSALAILDFIRSDPDVAAGIVGMPSYLLSMTAFACMFLIKVSIKYGGDLIERERVFEVTTALVSQFRSLSTGKWHLANLMTKGLEKMAATLQVAMPHNYSNGTEHAMMNGANGMVNGTNGVPQGGDMFANVDGELFFDYGMSFGLSPVFGDTTGFNMGMGTTPQVHFGDVDYTQITPQSG